MNDSKFLVFNATEKDLHFADIIVKTMTESALERGTGIGGRSADEIRGHIIEGNAVIATNNNGAWAGFCYLGVWDNASLVSNSGLIIAPQFRNQGIAGKLKTALLQLSVEKYPDADIIGITTGLAVMKINSSLGFYPTTFSEMPKDESFWNSCRTCVNYDVLSRTNKKFCLCTAMRVKITDAKARLRLIQ